MQSLKGISRHDYAYHHVLREPFSWTIKQGYKDVRTPTSRKFLLCQLRGWSKITVPLRQVVEQSLSSRVGPFMLQGFTTWIARRVSIPCLITKRTCSLVSTLFLVHMQYYAGLSTNQREAQRTRECDGYHRWPWRLKANGFKACSLPSSICCAIIVPGFHTSCTRVMSVEVEEILIYIITADNKFHFTDGRNLVICISSRNLDAIEAN